MPGYIFYEGRSRIDGKPIVGITTTDTKNPKTGPMVQTWILRSDIAPLDAVAQGEDESICGSCPLRGLIASGRAKNRGCYVNVGHAPRAIYLAYKAGKYRKLSPAFARHFMGKGLRYGAYGDPVAIPLPAWRMLNSLCTGKARTGYTHQWGQKRFSRWSTRLMASVHSVRESRAAQLRGWRTFRTASPIGFAPAPREIACPAAPEGGSRKTCAECGACNGRHDMADQRVSIVIISHGPGKKHASSLSLAAN